MELHEEDWDQSQPIDFKQAGSIMVTMGFLSQNATPEHPDYVLFEEMWDLMEGKEREGVKVADLAYMLKVSRGYRNPEIEVDCQPAEGKNGLAKMIIFDRDGNLQMRMGG